MATIDDPAPAASAAPAAPRTNLEIARSIRPRPIREVAEELGIRDEELLPYGPYITKIDARAIRESVKDRPGGRYVDVTGITPTPLGEDKSLTTIGLPCSRSTSTRRGRSSSRSKPVASRESRVASGFRHLVTRDSRLATPFCRA
jgi:Formate--tetrahydrofolate ligase